jgi:SAM-dependent methyltransferase
MLRKFLALQTGDRVLDLGCGSGRALVWNAASGANFTGVDISPYFAREALDGCALLLGDLRRLPLIDGGFAKAWSLDVLEHLSPQALADMLAEANRVLADGGALFVYTHVRKNGPAAMLVRWVNALARGLERLGAIDLKQERLRKSDHLNPIADHDELARVAAAAGFTIERITYYTPVIGAFVENVMVRMAERWLVRRTTAARKAHGADAETAAVRDVRSSAKARLRRGGFVYRSLVVLSAIMKLDLILFGRMRSGPFFALFRKTGPARPTSTTTPSAGR